jgi:hypothetical protein
MKVNIRPLAWILPSFVFLFACSIMPQAGTPVPSGGVIFEDDFSDDSSGWDALTDEYGTTAYSDGRYLISVADTMSYLYADPDKPSNLADAQIEVDVLESPDVVHDSGILCRIQDADNFYYFMIASDGYYAIGKFKDGEEEILGSEDMIEDTGGVIHTGVKANHLRADCIGDTLTLYANGTKLFETKDSDFGSGGVGLIAGSYDEAPVSVFFDNFVVTKP